jgi:hypothetical protein
VENLTVNSTDVEKPRKRGSDYVENVKKSAVRG